MLRVIFFTLVIYLGGCSKTFYLLFDEYKSDAYPEFCLHTNRYCFGFAQSIESITVIKLTKQNGYKENISNAVWYMESRSNKRLKRFQYGVVPEGWVQTVPPEPLKANVLYVLNGNYFMLDQYSRYTVYHSREVAIKALERQNS